MTIKAVVFDFGGVLLSYQKLDTVWEEMDREHNLVPGSIARIAKGPQFSAWLGPERSFFHGKISIEEIEDGLFTEFVNQSCGTSIQTKLMPLSPALGPGATQEYNIKLCSVVKQLQKMGYKTALLTNNCHIDKAKEYPRLPFDLTLFDVVVESCLENMAKPEPEIFHLTSNRLGLKPEELIFLDDLQENIETASTLGWKTIHVNPADETAAVEALEKVLGVQFTF